ncbi:MAG TPA: enoyl-CoA hydratase/isomerase family protein [Burkholderiales bacterium]|nr:enoyl-CoA hydratase/isomerase family protein [Burkholderiales bacterium]
MSEQLLIEQDGRILRVTFNRPEDNGISDAMANEFVDALNSAHKTSDLVLVKSIGPDYCTGRVRDPGSPPPATEAYSRRPEYDGIFNSYKAIRNSLVPIVTAIEGRAMGFGAAIASLCDVSFASDTATFNIPEIGHNVMPTMVMSAMYDRVNRNALMWMAYSTQFIDAQRALLYGMVSNVVPAAKLNEETEAFCKVLLSRPRPAILGLKEYLHVAPRMDELGAIDYARSIHSMVNTAAEMKRKH